MATDILGTQIGVDSTITYANSALINTVINLDIVMPTTVKNTYLINVTNTSLVTDLTITLFAKELSLGSGTRYLKLESFSVPKGSTGVGKIIEGLFVGSDLRIAVSNDTVLGLSDGFTASVRIREYE